MTSSTLRGSVNYVWDITRPLGQGATSMVYNGRNKRTGDSVAVKVFNPSSYQRPAEVQFREYEVMKKLNHENIVKLLAVEEEQTSYQKVLIMELCPNGSLFTLLEEPENGYGLSEEEFVLVLKHVSLGMKHLRDVDVVHRDIKPGNILRHIGEDGTSVYKLTDFGAARELQEEERFTSLYGTEEYLIHVVGIYSYYIQQAKVVGKNMITFILDHPDMYERAVLRRGRGQRFAGTIDLWSLGVTIYHTATGNLPFRPYGGRRNRETMYQITTKKEYGVISGIQRCEGGPIEWSRELPQTSRLSNGLKLLITPLLAGLLERNPERTMLFEKFFHESATLTSKISMDVFCPALCTNIKVFLDSGDVYSKLQEKLAEQTDIPASDQLILHDGQPLTTLVDPMTPIHNYPADITRSQPLIVYNKSDDHLCYCKPVKGTFPSLQTTGYLDVDASMAKKCSIVVYSILRAVEKLIARSLLIHTAVKHYRQELNHRVHNIACIFSNLVPSCRATQQWHENFLRLQNQQLRTLQLLLNTGVGGNNIKTLLTHLQETLRTSQAECQSSALRVEQIMEHSKKAMDGMKDMQQRMNNWRWDGRTMKEERWCERMQVVCSKTKHIYYKFKEDKAKRVLNFNEEQIHKIERASLSEMCSRGTSILETVDERVKLQAGAFKQWYSNACQCRKMSYSLESKLKDLQDQQSQFVTSLSSFCHKYQQLVEDRIKLIEQDSGVADLSLTEYDNIVKLEIKDINSEKSGNKESVKEILEGLKTSRTSLEEVMNLVHENNSLLYSINSLSLDGPTTWPPAEVT